MLPAFVAELHIKIQLEQKNCQAALSASQLQRIISY
jgi:hypothetical protein